MFMPVLAIKSGTTEIAGSVVKGSFSYFSGSTKDLGPTNVTGFYSGVDAPSGGYTVYQIGGLNGWTARVATDTTSLNSILISAGATGSTVDQRITWATNTNSVYINSGATVAGNVYTYQGAGSFAPTAGKFQNATNLIVIRVWKTDVNGNTLTTPVIGQILNLNNGTNGWINKTISNVTDVSTYWSIATSSAGVAGLTVDTNYNLIITSA